MENPFLKRQLPSPMHWDHEKHRLWQEARSLGRWRYAFRRLVVRFRSGDLVSVLAIFLLMMVGAVLLNPNGMASFSLRDLLSFFEVVPWFLPSLVALFTLVGFLEGWMRWDLYESIAAMYAGPPFVLEKLAADGTELVALINPRLPGGAQDRILRFDGQAWRTQFVNGSTERLIDVVVQTDGALLVTRAGGDLLTISPDGTVHTHSTGQEGAYIADLGQNGYLLAGTPISLWYTPEKQTPHEVKAQTTEPPAVRGGRAYLVDSEDRSIAIVDRGGVRRVPFPKGAQLTRLAVAADGAIYAAERTGADKHRWRVVCSQDEGWHPLPAPFQGRVYDLACDGTSLLALTEQGLYRYATSAATWNREAEAGLSRRFAQLDGQLVVIDLDSGKLLTRHGEVWQEEQTVVPLGELTR